LVLTNYTVLSYKQRRITILKIYTIIRTFVLAVVCIGSIAFADRTPQNEFALTLGEETFDPRLQVIVSPTEWEVASQVGNDLRLVQFDGPIQEKWVEAMRASGVIPVQYIHPYTYITWAEPENRDAVQALPNVRWAGDFLNGYRVLPKWRALSARPIDTKIMVYKGVALEGVLEQLRDAGATRIDHSSLDTRFEIVSFVAPGDSYLAISTIPGVFTVQPKPTDGGLRSEMSNQVNVGNIDSGGMAFPGYESWLDIAGVNGNGVIVAIVDGGSDEGHVDLAGQFVACDGQSCGGSTSSSHGTHCAGTIGATGASGSTDSNGFLQGQGVAPSVSLLEQVYSPMYQQAGGMTQLMVESYQNGAIASSNSWGPAGSPQGYDIDTLEVDIAVRDADPDTEGNQQFTYVLAIMNGNGGTSSQGSPDEAKNIITVGSTKMRDSGGNQYLEINDISSNSAHGPCLDGRTIPHIVAPGCQTLSTIPGTYSMMCGTSMACPQVAGGVALFVEQYRNTTGEEPTPALIKGALAVSALDLSGNSDADGGNLGHPFDSKQGWGRMDLQSTLVDGQGSTRYFDAPVVLNQTGDQWSVTVSPVDPAKPIRVMLVWTDALGHGLGGSSPAWNNDLDLTVSTGLTTYKGNNFGSQGWSTSGGSADMKNNTEGVFLGPIAPGQATIIVTAANLNSDGIPGFGDAIDQDFSVVCYNCASEPDYSLAIEPSSIEVCAPESTVCTVTIGQTMGYEEEVVLSVVTDSGILHDLSTFSVVPPAEVQLYLNIQSSVPDGEHIVQVVGIAPADGSMHQTEVVVHVSAGIPDSVMYVEPANGATEISVVPIFTWVADPGVSAWQFQLSTTDSEGGLVQDVSDLTEPTFTLSAMLESNTPYFWRVRASNTCGSSAWSYWSTFRTTDAMTILLVDDDDNSPDVRSSYTSMLDEAGLLYEIFDTNNSNNEPSTQELQGYPLVIWFTGDEWGGFAGPGSAGESALASYIDAGGALVLSSQDYLYDNQLTSFGQYYLGIGAFTSDVNQSSVTGASIFENLGTITLNFPFTNYSDVVSPSLSAELSFSGNQGDAGTKLNGAHSGGAVFLGFPIEAMSNDAQQLFMSDVLSWALVDTSEPCPGDCNDDGVVDVVDILAVIDAWGTDSGCDVNGDGVIDVADLLAVVGSWGVCP
jgi:serine protease AprX